MFFKKLTVDLRPHNKKSYKASKKMFEAYDRVSFTQATGTGKSYVIMQFLDDYKEVNKLLVAPSSHILDDFKNNNQIDIQKTIFITYQKLLSLYNRDDMNKLGNLEFICLDEMHRAGAKRWELAVKELLNLNPNAKLLGATATPIRSIDSKDMTKELFNGNCSYELTLVDAMIQRILPVPKYISALYDIEEYTSDKEIKLNSIKDPDKKIYQLLDDLKNLKIELCSTLSIDTILREHLLETIEQNDGAKILVFCNDVKRLKASEIKIKKWFSDAFELPIETYTYHYKDKNGYKNFEKFKDSKKEGSIKLLLSIEKLNEGIHINDIDSIVMLRKTTSSIIYHQQIGRVLSISGSKKPIIFDLVNNYNNVDNSTNLFKELKEGLEKIKKANSSKNKKEQDIVIDFHDYTHDAIKTFKEIEYRLLSKPWSQEEDNILIANKKMLIKNLVKLLPGRTRSSIANRKNILKIYRKKTFWSQEEDCIILNNPKLNLNDLHILLPDKGIKSIYYRKKHILNMYPKQNRFSKEEDEIIIKNKDISLDELNKLIPNRTRGSLASRRKIVIPDSIKKRTIWDEEKISELEKVFNKKTNKELEKIFDLPYSLIYSKAHRLNIKKQNTNLWSKKEDDLLRKFYPYYNEEELKSILDRTYVSIKARARRLKLKKDIYWSEEEVQVLRRYYLTENINDLKKRLNRSISSIKNKVRLLGLKKNRR